MRAVLLVVSLASAAIGQMQPGERTIRSDSEVGAVEFSADGSSLAGLCRDNKIRHWDERSGELKRTFALEKLEGNLAFASTGTAVTSTSDGGITIWNLQTGEKARHIGGTHQRARGIALSSDRNLLANGSYSEKNRSETTVHLWDASGKERFAVPAGAGGLSAVAISPDGATLVAGSYDTDVRAWSTRNGELVKLIDEIPVATFVLKFSPDGKYLAAAGVDKIIRLYDTKTWKLVRQLTGQPEMISAMSFSPDGKTIVTGGFNELTVKHPVHILLWDFQTGKVLRTLPAPRMVTSAAFSPDGKLVAIADREKLVRLLPSGR
jgi:dipeptidyl aminopeptidase/acylaminoacyl peptidase